MTLDETFQEAFCSWSRIAEKEAHFSLVFGYPENMADEFSQTKVETIAWYGHDMIKADEIGTNT